MPFTRRRGDLGVSPTDTDRVLPPHCSAPCVFTPLRQETSLSAYSSRSITVARVEPITNLRGEKQGFQ